MILVNQGHIMVKQSYELMCDGTKVLGFNIADEIMFLVVLCRKSLSQWRWRPREQKICPL